MVGCSGSSSGSNRDMEVRWTSDEKKVDIDKVVLGLRCDAMRCDVVAFNGNSMHWFVYIPESEDEYEWRWKNKYSNIRIFELLYIKQADRQTESITQYSLFITDSQSRNRSRIESNRYWSDWYWINGYGIWIDVGIGIGAWNFLNISFSLFPVFVSYEMDDTECNTQFRMWYRIGQKGWNDINIMNM